MGRVHESFTKEREERISIAQELGYGERVIQLLKQAKSEVELTNIMIDARRSIR